jgi:hypothetical protein
MKDWGTEVQRAENISERIKSEAFLFGGEGIFKQDEQRISHEEKEEKENNYHREDGNRVCEKFLSSQGPRLLSRHLVFPHKNIKGEEENFSFP